MRHLAIEFGVDESTVPKAVHEELCLNSQAARQHLGQPEAAWEMQKNPDVPEASWLNN